MHDAQCHMPVYSEHDQVFIAAAVVRCDVYSEFTATKGELLGSLTRHVSFSKLDVMVSNSGFHHLSVLHKTTAAHEITSHSIILFCHVIDCSTLISLSSFIILSFHLKVFCDCSPEWIFFAVY